MESLAEAVAVAEIENASGVSVDGALPPRHQLLLSSHG